MLAWVAAALIAWLMVMVLLVSLLRAARQGDALTRAAFAEAGSDASDPAAPRSATFDLLAREVQAELPADEVIIVTRDARAPRRAIIVAAAGLSCDIRGASLEPRESIAAAVALRGLAVIALDQSSLASRAAAHSGHTLALPLAAPGSAISVARHSPRRPLTADDLYRLRVLVQRHAGAVTDTQHAAEATSVSRRSGFFARRPEAAHPDVMERPPGPERLSRGRGAPGR